MATRMQMTEEESRWLESLYPLFVKIATAKVPPDQARDVTQDTATAILKHIDQARQQDNKTKWAIRVHLNQITDWGRRETRRRAATCDAGVRAEPRDRAPDPERLCGSKEALDRLEGAAEKALSRAEREIYRLMKQELSCREIAQTRQTAVDTTKKQILEIRRKLRSAARPQAPKKTWRARAGTLLRNLDGAFFLKRRISLKKGGPV